jgi:Prolyl-tRNA synthetase
VIVPIRQSEAGVLDACKKLYESLKKENVRVKLDDDESKTPGWKFAEYEMKGIPLRVEVGPRDLAKGECVLTKRVNGEKSVTKLETLPQEIPAILASIHEAMYQKAKAFLDSHIAEAHSIDELNAALNKGGFVKMAFCEKEECELKIKELTNGGTARCLAKEIPAPGTKCPVCGEEAKVVAYFAKAY